MRGLLACALFAFLSVPGSAEEPAPVAETVLVKGADLSGIWKIETPDGGKVSIGIGHSRADFGPMEAEFCRLAQKGGDLTVRCLGPHHITQSGNGELDDGQLHLAWGWMTLRLVIDAPLISAMRFDGRFAVKFMGMRYEAPVPATGIKLLLSFDAPDPDGLKPVLIQTVEEWMQGGLKLPHDDAAIKSHLYDREPTPPQKMRTFGKMLGAVYLGKVDSRDADGKRAPFFSVYDVEFENGERLCGLHRRGDGVLDAFICV